MTPDELLERMLEFAAVAGQVADRLPESRMGRHIAGQLVRCGTSPAPNYAEGCAAESRADFIHKLSICLKELRETQVWVRLVLKAGLLPAEEARALLDEGEQLARIVAQSLVTARRSERAAPRR